MNVVLKQSHKWDNFTSQNMKVISVKNFKNINLVMVLFNWFANVLSHIIPYSCDFLRNPGSKPQYHFQLLLFHSTIIQVIYTSHPSSLSLPSTVLLFPVCSWLYWSHYWQRNVPNALVIITSKCKYLAGSPLQSKPKALWVLISRAIF